MEGSLVINLEKKYNNNNLKVKESNNQFKCLGLNVIKLVYLDHQDAFKNGTEVQLYFSFSWWANAFLSGPTFPCSIPASPLNYQKFSSYL